MPSIVTAEQPPRNSGTSGVASPRGEAASLGTAATEKPLRRFSNLIAERFQFPPCASDPELARRVRLVSLFGVVGFFFAALYAAFYFAIGHNYGAAIIVSCGLLFGGTPFLMRAARSWHLGGNVLIGIMVLGFFALCLVEGGIYGHAIAWLASVPLCGLLLTTRMAARVWTAMSLVACAAVALIEVRGTKLVPFYNPDWHSTITLAGYLGLILFLFILGVIFENGRRRAFNKLQEALAKLESSNAQLLHLNNEKNEFMSIAAHDLNNPLTAIIGNAELLGLVKDPVKIDGISRNIFTAGTRMRDLIKDLLDANAIEEGRFGSNLERCDLRALLGESVEANRTSATRKKIELRADGLPELFVRSDRKATLQIFDNLISNAIKFSPPGSTVTVFMLAEREHAAVSIRDQGPGLSAEDQAKLFRRFTRLTARPTGDESSTGLGLSIVKRLAEGMGGSVACESILGQGAEFIVRLPRWREG